MQMSKVMSADRVGGLIWVAFGLAVIYGSWIMDRLESLQIPPATAPGVVPALLGLGIVIFGSVLIIRRTPDGDAAIKTFDADPAIAAAPGEQADDFHWKRIALSWAICMIYAGVLLGRGVHYWILTAAFLFLHMLLLDDDDRVPAPVTRQRLLIAATVAPAFATVVMLVFQHVFLVRLP